MLLHDQAWAVGHRVRDLALGEVRIKAIHRGERSLDPRRELVLAAGDTLVLFGTAVAMEQAEHHFWETEQEVASRPGRMTDVVLPLESRHTDVLKGKRISMTATLADGSPLPKGLALDARTGVVSGKVLVQSRETTLDVRVIATDELGNRSEVVHHLHILPAAGNQAAVGMDQAATLAARPSFSEQLAACPVA